MMDILMEMLMPLMIILSFIIFVIASVYLIWLMICVMKGKRNNDRYEVIEETKESYDESTVCRAIIVLGDREIKVEVDCYEIDYNIIKITDKYGEVYLTYTKNVLLTSEYRI